MNKKKMLVFIITLLICVGIITRIVYVNMVYPSARTEYVEDKFTGNKFEICIKDTRVYAKEAWGQYIDENNIVPEQDFYGEYADVAMIYKPDSEYNVVVIGVDIKNVSGKSLVYDNQFAMRNIWELQSLLYNTYYTSLFNSESVRDVQLDSGETFSARYVYIIQEEHLNYELEYHELGVNQRIKLHLK